MFDSGLLTIATKTLTTVDGGMPTEVLNDVGSAYYGDRTISYNRLYQARGADCQIDRLVRVPFDTEIMPEQYVIFEDDSQFRVDAVTDVIVKVSTRAKELTLIRNEELLDVERRII